MGGTRSSRSSFTARQEHKGPRAGGKTKRLSKTQDLKSKLHQLPHAQCARIAGENDSAHTQFVAAAACLRGHGRETQTMQVSPPSR